MPTHKGNVQLVRFRHKGLRQLHEEGNARGVPPAMADKLRKLLFALKTAGHWSSSVAFPDGGSILSKVTGKGYGA